MGLPGWRVLGRILQLFPRAQSSHTETLKLAIELDYSMVATDRTFPSKPPLPPEFS